jgi:hypothetical protein
MHAFADTAAASAIGAAIDAERSTEEASEDAATEVATATATTVSFDENADAADVFTNVVAAIASRSLVNEQAYASYLNHASLMPYPLFAVRSVQATTRLPFL